MLDSKKYIYDTLRASSSLTTILGSADKIQFMYPNDFNALPIVTYQELDNRNIEFYDNNPFADESIIQLDIWSNTVTTAIAKIIDTVLLPLMYTRDFSSDVPEPDSKIFHRVIRYSRVFTADDLDNA